MGRIVFQCYPPVCEVSMTSALARRPFPLIPLALLAACNTETSNERVLGIQAMSFANSEWSEPVHLDAPVNSRCQDQTPTMSKDELSLYFLSDRPGGFGNLVSTTGCMDKFDLWVAQRSSTDGPWETAVNPRPVIHTSRNEAGPALSADGHLLFFASDRDGTPGIHDIYVSRRADPQDDLGWGPPTPLAPDANTALHESRPFSSQRAGDRPATLHFIPALPTATRMD